MLITLNPSLDYWSVIIYHYSKLDLKRRLNRSKGSFKHSLRYVYFSSDVETISFNNCLHIRMDKDKLLCH